MISPQKTQQINPYFGKIQTAIAEIVGIDPEDISYGMEFDEVSMTPVEMSEFFSRVNRECMIHLHPSDLTNYPTLGELSEFIEDELE